MTTDDDATKWLQDGPAQSTHALDMIKRKPPTSGGLVQIKNQGELEAALNDTAQKGGGLSFDGSVDPIKIDGTLEVALRDLGEAGPKFLFNGLRVESTNTDGVTCCLRFKGNTKRLAINQLDVFGNAYASPGCGNGVEVCSDGGAIWLSKFTEINSSWCRGAGIRFQGDVFENVMTSLDAKDNFGNGIEFSNIGGVISNLMAYGTNASRNVGFGVAMQDGAGSLDMFGGSMITNGLGGIDAPNGIRSVLYVNGENTGESLINVPSAGWGTRIIGCNMSSNGLINPAQPDAKPARFVIGSSDRNVIERDCFVAPYGDNPPQMSVWSSASRTTVPLKRGARPSNSMTVPPMRRRGQ